jgi:hypothetical protein
VERVRALRHRWFNRIRGHFGWVGNIKRALFEAGGAVAISILRRDAAGSIREIQE